ncbi:FAD-dependent monooxygenase [Rhodococcus sp. 14-2470-1a]|uniref:FAD-dependent oxidoreductase n=1 Tax=Rhodococcus sp. 14-2470-1a TaxID=2023150 RepID=UPI000B9AFA70|nr:FAD-dependent monooxygenase [Rhodococcus sp. 14-2470-1a]OZF45737.1 2,4-dichlorophenol 6-monooxygenase [Rhodococcus sp. 14-2470-1a]
MTTPDYDTDVLIIGSGPAGGAAALMLATYGIDTVLVSKYGWVANTPRAHITNQRTLEVLRDLGVDDEALALGSPQDIIGDTVLCTSLAGEEIGRISAWGSGDAQLSEYAQASPCPVIDLPQTYMEPILISNAAKRGATCRFDTEFVSLTQDADGVTATLRDRLRGDEYTLRARYLIGADGARSLVAEQIGLPIAGRSGVGGSMNICFTADLSQYAAHRPSVLYWAMRPGAHMGGIGMGLIRMVRPWNEWLLTWGYDIDDEPPVLDEDQARTIVHDLLGDDSIEVKIDSTSLWTVNHSYATEFGAGRVFCAGDAVHRHPPSNGLGSNTSIQDSFNLAWKLAAVIRGFAAPALLDTYTDERAPVGKQIVDRANLSRTQFGPIFEALGISGGTDDEGIVAGLAACRAGDAEGARRRRALEEAIALKNYEFNAHGVELNQRYESSAVLVDSSCPAESWTRDRELHHQPTTRPGAKIPHAWLVDGGGHRISTLDLVGRGQFSVVTGLSGGLWVQAVDAVGKRSVLPLRVVRIGTDDARDAYGHWARLREIDEDGVILVRPDGVVAWRSARGPDDEETAVTDLTTALSAVLGQTVATDAVTT